VLASFVPRLLDVKAACAYLGVSRWTLDDLRVRGTLLPVTLPGLAEDGSGRRLRRVLYDRHDLDAFVDRLKARGPGHTSDTPQHEG
jgi:hypothetical protein